MVLKEALEIYKGNRIGLQMVPDTSEIRQRYLREEMQDLLIANIDACIKEFQEGLNLNSSTLRVAIEFCIRVGAVDHLFGELFEKFAD